MFYSYCFSGGAHATGGLQTPRPCHRKGEPAIASVAGARAVLVVAIAPSCLPADAACGTGIDCIREADTPLHPSSLAAALRCLQTVTTAAPRELQRRALTRLRRLLSAAAAGQSSPVVAGPQTNKTENEKPPQPQNAANSAQAAPAAVPTGCEQRAPLSDPLFRAKHQSVNLGAPKGEASSGSSSSRGRSNSGSGYGSSNGEDGLTCSFRLAGGDPVSSIFPGVGAPKNGSAGSPSHCSHVCPCPFQPEGPHEPSLTYPLTSEVKRPLLRPTSADDATQPGPCCCRAPSPIRWKEVNATLAAAAQALTTAAAAAAEAAAVSADLQQQRQERRLDVQQQELHQHRTRQPQLLHLLQQATPLHNLQHAEWYSTSQRLFLPLEEQRQPLDPSLASADCREELSESPLVWLPLLGLNKDPASGRRAPSACHAAEAVGQHKQRQQGQKQWQGQHEQKQEHPLVEQELGQHQQQPERGQQQENKLPWQTELHRQDVVAPFPPTEQCVTHIAAEASRGQGGIHTSNSRTSSSACHQAVPALVGATAISPRKAKLQQEAYRATLAAVPPTITEGLRSDEGASATQGALPECSTAWASWIAIPGQRRSPELQATESHCSVAAAHERTTPPQSARQPTARGAGPAAQVNGRPQARQALLGPLVAEGQQAQQQQQQRPKQHQQLPKQKVLPQSSAALREPEHELKQLRQQLVVQREAMRRLMELPERSMSTSGIPSAWPKHAASVRHQLQLAEKLQQHQELRGEGAAPPLTPHQHPRQHHQHDEVQGQENSPVASHDNAEGDAKALQQPPGEAEESQLQRDVLELRLDGQHKQEHQQHRELQEAPERGGTAGRASSKTLRESLWALVSRVQSLASVVSLSQQQQQALPQAKVQRQQEAGMGLRNPRPALGAHVRRDSPQCLLGMSSRNQQPVQQHRKQQQQQQEIGHLCIVGMSMTTPRQLPTGILQPSAALPDAATHPSEVTLCPPATASRRRVCAGPPEQLQHQRPAAQTSAPEASKPTVPHHGAEQRGHGRTAPWAPPLRSDSSRSSRSVTQRPAAPASLPVSAVAAPAQTQNGERVAIAVGEPSSRPRCLSSPPKMHAIRHAGARYSGSGTNYNSSYSNRGFNLETAPSCSSCLCETPADGTAATDTKPSLAKSAAAISVQCPTAGGVAEPELPGGQQQAHEHEAPEHVGEPFGVQPRRSPSAQRSGAPAAMLPARPLTAAADAVAGTCACVESPCEQHAPSVAVVEALQFREVLLAQCKPHASSEASKAPERAATKITRVATNFRPPAWWIHERGLRGVFPSQGHGLSIGCCYCGRSCKGATTANSTCANRK